MMRSWSLHAKNASIGRSRIGTLDAGPARLVHLFGVFAGSLAAGIGLVVLVGGWALDIYSLRSVLPGLSTMKANTALGIAMLGVSVALSGGIRGPRFIASAAAATVALSIGLLSLAEYAFNWNARIDQALFKDTVTSLAGHPGRPAISTSLMLALLGIAQLCSKRTALLGVKTVTALAAALMAWAALNGFVFGPQALSEVPLFSSIALHTAAMLLLLSLGVLASAPVSWPISVAVAKGMGGTVCRWLLPTAILAPPILGWLLNHVGEMRIYPDLFRWALYAYASSLGSVWLILLLAHRITLIERERAVATELSLHDSLTGVPNRRAFDSFLAESFNLAKRHNHPLSLMLLDIDRFKAYNDRYGHPAGDELLKKFGTLVSALVRETDFVARVGGEEFAVALPETDLAGAWVIAERVRVGVERSRFFGREVTVSVGIAAISGKTSSSAMLIQECDAALYRAKATGRNRVSPSVDLAAASTV